ncbi:DUF1289 domain-containing protein [Anianabacter salinae]|uniref:DUF1289 domain-containing protein n=1 Tax=Anianabacter salinae TaxID=2851023 RepID=UPI00225E01C9|nr:DUF1289 domain-containing protein [Anianabacter salinae]MBV0911871.1 DUF1289 domain-containing protein [Anianabacter salinae]
MSDDTWTRDEVQSPCVRICVVHPEERLCVGCLRTLDEIAAWSRMTGDERRAVLEALPDRAPRLRKRRGGRAGRTGRDG